jgi:site-specific recombinase XerD
MDPAAPFTLETALLGPLTIPGGAAHATEIEALSHRAAVYATRAHGAGTRRAYRSAWRAYEAWCHSLGRQPLNGNPETIAMYVVRRADDGLAVSSLRVALAAIRAAHRLAGLALDLRDPRLAMVVEGIVRAKGTRPRRQAAPAVPEVLRRMLASGAPDTSGDDDAGPGNVASAAAAGQTGAVGETGAVGQAGVACETTVAREISARRGAIVARDHAMLLLGFGAALRRSELVALTLGEVEAVPGRGVRVLVRRSKTDQHGKGQEVAVAANRADRDFCPQTALERWLAYRRAAPDLPWTLSPEARAARPLFCAVTKSGRLTGAGLSDKAVARLVKTAAQAAGLDPAKYSGHSLRAGLATAAGDAGAGLAELMRQTRHKSTAVALAYLRPADLWRNNVTTRLFAAKTPDES